MFAHNLTRAEATTRSALIRDPAHPLDYRIELDLTGGDGSGGTLPEPESTFLSTTEVGFRSTGPAGEPVGTHLDLIADRVLSASLDGVELDPATFTGSRLPFRVAPGAHRLLVRSVNRYSRSGQGLHRFVDPVDQKVYLYTQFEVSDARRVFGCFEQPDLKATYTLEVTAPAGWTVVANTTPAEPVGRGDGTARWSFPTSAVFSTYLVGLVAGEYARVTDVHRTAAGTLPMSILCRASIREHLDPERIFAITKAGFDVFEPAFGFAYPFGKYDQAFVPEYNMGAMENVGCVTLRDDLVFRSRTTSASYESRDNTILHELAHMWFGDLVTMTWWDDLWLKESFAEWASHFAQSAIDESRGGDARHAWATFANARKTWAYRADQLPSTHPVAADMVDLEAVESNFDGITYAKGASVLRQLVAYVGRDAFLAGARDYFARHAYDNTRLSDLLAALTGASGRDLSSWSGQWLETSGVDTLRPVVEVDADGVITAFAIEQEAGPDGLLRDHRVAVGLYRRDPGGPGGPGVPGVPGVPGEEAGAIRRDTRVELDVSGARTEVPELVGVRRPELLLVNDDDLTYAKVRLDEVSAATLTTDLHRVDSALARAVCWGAAWDMCRDAELPSADYLRIVAAGVGVEDDLTAVRAVLGQAQVAVESYTPPTTRAALALDWERRLAGLLADADPGSDHQLALARAYADAATGADRAYRVAALQGWLAGTAVPAGLDVDTDLRWWVLTRLARLGAVGPEEIAAEQARDATVSGAEQAAGARAALPDADSKAAAWRAAVTENTISNAEQRSICLAFWQPGQSEVLAGYVERYRQLAVDVSAGSGDWAAKGRALQENAVGRLFPRIADDPDAVDALAGWAEGAALSPMVRRKVAEGLDDLHRAVRCQRAASAATEPVTVA